MIDSFTAIDAERLRRRHCDKKDNPGHKCLGKMTILPGMVMFNCPLCGEEMCRTTVAMGQLDKIEEDSPAKYVLGQVPKL